MIRRLAAREWHEDERRVKRGTVALGTVSGLATGKSYWYCTYSVKGLCGGNTVSQSEKCYHFY